MFHNLQQRSIAVHAHADARTHPTAGILRQPLLGRRLNHHATAGRRHTLDRKSVTHAIVEDVQTGCAQTHPRRVRARVAHHVRDRLTQNP